MINIFNLNQMKLNPTQITIDISGLCNAKCPFCLRQMTDNVPKELMDKGTFYNIIEQVKKIKSIKTVSLSAYGEAMMHPDFDEFIDYLHKEKYKILIITNMSLANQHFEALLKTHFIIMSIEGYDKETYETFRRGLSFEKVYYNMVHFDKIVHQERLNHRHTPSRMANCLLNAKTNIEKYKQTWQDLTDVIKLNNMVNPISWNSDEIRFCNMINSDLSGIIACNVLSENKTICSEPFKTIVIHPNGRLALCCNDANCSLDFGDYKNIKKSFYHNKNLNRIRKELLQNKVVICKNCKNNIIINNNEENR